MADWDNRVVAVVGPTASGKTSLAIALAKRFSTELVSFDSMQIYEGMDIASAKPTPQELAAAKHHMISFVPQTQPYSVADYCRDASLVVDQLLSCGKLPILVGGTGLYLDSLLSNLSFGEEQSDPALRQQLNDRPCSELMKELKTIDAAYAQKVNENDKKRIVRALEVYIKTGNTMTQQLQRSRTEPPRYRPIYVGLAFENREVLYRRIDERVDAMVEAGLVEEARECYQKGQQATSAQAIGHKELFPYFAGERSLEDCIAHLKQATRHYAKRQISWFGRNEEIHWLYVDRLSKDELIDAAEQWILDQLGGK